MLILILIIITINFYVYFKLNFVSPNNLFWDVIIVRISQTYRMYRYGFLCLCTITYTFGYCVKICYCINFKLLMKYCAFWHCDDMLLGLLITIPISVYLHRTNILRFNNQFTSSYNFSVNCCVFLYCICFWCEHDNVKSIGLFVSCVYASIFNWFK